MNKTVKTIAWICLVLGIMGTALDAAAYIGVRNAFSDRQARVEEFRAQVESGELPGFKGGQDGEAPSPGERDRDRDGSGEFGPQHNGGFVRGSALDRRLSGRQDGRRTGNHDRFGLPLLALALGPVLLVIGAVILIVNREPAMESVKSKKEPAGKSEKSK